MINKQAQEELLYKFLASRNQVHPISDDKKNSKYNQSAVVLNKEEVQLYLGFTKVQIQRIVSRSDLFTRPHRFSLRSNKVVYTTANVVLLNPKYSYLLKDMPNFELLGKSRVAYKEISYKGYNEQVFMYLLEHPDTKSLSSISRGTGIYFYAVREAVNSLKNTGALEVIDVQIGKKIEHRFNLQVKAIMDREDSSEFSDMKDIVIKRSQVKNEIRKLNYDNQQLAIKALFGNSTREQKDEYWATKNKNERKIAQLKEEMPVFNPYWNVNTIDRLSKSIKKIANGIKIGDRRIRNSVIWWCPEGDLTPMNFNELSDYCKGKKESIFNKVSDITLAVRQMGEAIVDTTNDYGFVEAVAI